MRRADPPMTPRWVWFMCIGLAWETLLFAVFFEPR